jgi:outer membrane protein OmpA-like peptidoglycan-associated protein
MTLPLLAACAAERPAAPPVHVVFFQDDDAGLDAAALTVIQDAARLAAQDPNAMVRVLGFVAPDGTAPEPLLLLSRQRADRVAAELRSFGVPANRILVRGRGAVPAADLPVESRRVEIHIGPG